MAKQAKQVEAEVSSKNADKFVAEILERYERIESARGTYMNAARREREAMTTIYEGMAARGVSQKASRTEIKIVMAMERIKGWLSDLEEEDRKMVQRLAKARGDRKQLLLFNELPDQDAPTRAKRGPGRPRKEQENVFPFEPSQPEAAAATA